MNHKAISQVIERAELAKADSDTSYFLSLLYLGEAVLKTAVAAAVSSISDDPDRNRYRIEYGLVRASGIGDWAAALEDCFTGTASQFLVNAASTEQREMTQKVKCDDWRYQAIIDLKKVLDSLNISADPIPQKANLQKWFLLFSTLRNKTRGHGAPSPDKCSVACLHLRDSLDLLVDNLSVFSRPWVYMHQNLSGKYRISPIAGDPAPFDRFKNVTGEPLENGVYLFLEEPMRVSLIESSAEVRDFFFANGGFTSNKYDCISYATGITEEGNSGRFATPPGRLPGSNTEGTENLETLGNCFSSVPEIGNGYIAREELESELLQLLSNDRHPVITLVGRGGIGKTSLALATLPRIAEGDRFDAIIWFSARDLDLHETGPKPVRPHILSEGDVSSYFVDLLNPEERKTKGFSAREYFESALGKSPIGPTLFVFDNFETTRSPVELFTWIDTFVRNPNKVLITTRLRDFKGDYPVDVKGMTEPQSRDLIAATAKNLKVDSLLSEDYVQSVISQSEGHPYVIKILLGEVEKEKRAVNVKLLIAGSEEILKALFERTYEALSEAARRVFLTLASWNSSIPRLALEAVLLRPGNDHSDVGEAIEMLLKSSLIEMDYGESDAQMVLTLPLAAREFGRAKLNVSYLKTAVMADREILQMLGVNQPGTHGKVGFYSRLEKFFRSVARRVADGSETIEDFRPILEMMARNYHRAWLLLADLYSETEENCESAKEAYSRFLETEPSGSAAAEAWRRLAILCNSTSDTLGEVHAFIERAQISSVPFAEISETANRFNHALHSGELDLGLEERNVIGNRLLQVMAKRKSEAGAIDFSRMAWLSLNLNQKAKAADFVDAGLLIDPGSQHLRKLQEKLGV